MLLDTFSVLLRTVRRAHQKGLSQFWYGLTVQGYGRLGLQLVLPSPPSSYGNCGIAEDEAWIQVEQLSGNTGFLLSLVLMTHFLPNLIFFPVSGVVADRCVNMKLDFSPYMSKVQTLCSKLSRRAITAKQRRWFFSRGPWSRWHQWKERKMA